MEHAGEPETKPATIVRTVGIILLVFCALLWIGLFAVFYVVPRFEDIYQKFSFPGGLPAFTQTLLNLSHWVQTWCFTILPAGLLFLVGLLQLCCTSRSGAWMALVFGGTILAAELFLLYLVTAGLFLPLCHLTP